MNNKIVFLENKRQPFFVGNDINIVDHQVKINDVISLYTDAGLIVAKVVEFFEDGLTVKILDASNDSRVQDDDVLAAKSNNIFGVFKTTKEQLK